jgi:hypothetical protein
MSSKKWEIYGTQGQGSILLKTCKSLEKALSWVEKHKDEASFGIKLPDGTWHKWEEDTAAKEAHSRLMGELCAEAAERSEIDWARRVPYWNQRYD